MMVYSLDESFMKSIMMQLIKRQSARTVLKNTKLAAAVADGEFNGWRRGMVEALTAYATEQRLEAFRPYKELMERKHVLAPYESEVHSWVLGQLSDWNDGRWSDKSDDEWYMDMITSWTEKIVLPEAIASDLERYRRKAVLAGIEEPMPNDAQWLQEERDKLTSVVAPYDKVLRKISGT